MKELMREGLIIVLFIIIAVLAHFLFDYKYPDWLFVGVILWFKIHNIAYRIEKLSQQLQQQNKE